jgi:hypothetical protein
MRREVELYINTAGYGEAITYQRLDLFEEQSINITNSLQDIKDIAKVFTDFTQQFSIPASNPNSKVFKHYYNFDIDGGYDARVKREALIKINGQDYREGFMSLSSVSMKKQLPYAYKVIFYGKTVNLKRLFGDDELDDLASYPNAYLSQFNQSYSAANAETGFTKGYNLSGGSLVNNTGSTAGDLCYPFISGKSHYYYDSGNNAPNLNEDVESRNVENHSNSGGQQNGLNLIDLKPAIRLYHIILGIEDKYGLTFTKNGTNDFFSTSNNQFYQLYLWLHREKGDLSSQIAESVFSIDLDDYAFTNTTPTGQPDPRSNSNQDLVTSLTDQIVETVEVFYNYTISVTPAGAGLYSLEMLDTQTGNLITPTSNATDLSGSNVQVTRTFVIRKESADFGTQTFTPVFKVKTKGGITSFKVDSLAITKTVREVDLGSGSASDVGYDANYTFNSGGPNTISTGLDVVDNMPKMKVIDFLTSIFKMFNLTAFYDDRRILANGTTNADFGKIKVMTVDAFYSEGVSYSIDKYLYTDKHTVSKANIYSEIDFLYQDPSTFAIINSNEITNDEFGNEKLTNRSADINNPLAFDGGKYDVRLGFEHIMFEKMSDQSSSTANITIQWGWMVNKDEFPVLGKPLVFYCHKHSSTNFYLQDGTDIDEYIRPANTLTVTAGSNLQTIHFGEEADEYFAQVNPESLFKNYYFNYIVPIYNEKSRLSKFQAILPIDIVIKMKLNDRFVLSGKSYKINSIKMNINTGKADLELINEV